MHLSGRSRGGARETRPAPLFLDQTIFFGDQAPLLWMTPPPPPPPPYLKVWTRHCIFYRGTYSEQRDHTMCQVVSHRRAKTMENYRIVRPEKRSWSLTRGGRFREILKFCRALTGKNLVSVLDPWSCWRVVAYEKWWSHMEVRQYHVYSLLLFVSSGPQNCFHDAVNAQHNSLHILLGYETLFKL